MTRSTTKIETKDGSCETSVFRPSTGSGPWPGVIVFMDGLGIRPSLFELGERIAEHGYFVILPDLFYRAGPYTSPDPAKLFSDPEVFATWRSKFMATANQANVREDTRAFLDFLAAQSDVKQPKVGTTGYCMGGGLSLAAAGNFPDRVVAAASYHGGRLATDAPDSPHLLAPNIKARVYVGAATDDATFPEDQKQRLEAALSAAGVAHTIETYPAKHGWVPKDMPVHDPAQAERHYETLFALFDGALKGDR